MILTKEECLEELEKSRYLDVSIVNQDGWDEWNGTFDSTTIFKTFEQLIHEYFNNPPLKFEELKEGMWVWDKDFNRFGEWLKILIVKINDYDEKIIKALCVGTNEIMIRSYKKDRFYRNQVD